MDECQILRLVEKVDDNKICLLFNQFHEKFESKNFSQINITTKKQFDCVSTLNNCLDKFFFENDDMNYHLNSFWQKVNICSLTYAEFEFYNKLEHLNILLEHLLDKSEEIKKQTNTAIIKLPLTAENVFFKFNNNFNKMFISSNLKNENFLILTNSESLIELYELL